MIKLTRSHCHEKEISRTGMIERHKIANGVGKVNRKQLFSLGFFLQELRDIKEN